MLAFARFRSEILARLLGTLAASLEEFDRNGFASSRDSWRSMHAYQGRRVRVLPAATPPSTPR